MKEYIEDVLTELVNEAKSLREKRLDEFNEGRLNGIYTAVLIMLNRTVTWGIEDQLSKEWQDFSPEELLNIKDDEQEQRTEPLAIANGISKLSN